LHVAILTRIGLAAYVVVLILQGPQQLGPVMGAYLAAAFIGGLIAVQLAEHSQAVCGHAPPSAPCPTTLQVL
jgi:hypothetical protein